MPTQSATFGLETAPFEVTLEWDTETPLLCTVLIERDGGLDKILMNYEDLIDIAGIAGSHIAELLRFQASQRGATYPEAHQYPDPIPAGEIPFDKDPS